MVELPQHGGCVCGEIRFHLREDPVTVYACHCTDCQTETGSTCLLAVVIRSEALEFEGTEPEVKEVTLADGRAKGGWRCPRCMGPIGSPPRGDGLTRLDGGAFDDTSWLEPAGHIWTRSAQPWVRIPEQALCFAEQPSPADFVSFARAWKERGRSS